MCKLLFCGGIHFWVACVFWERLLTSAKQNQIPDPNLNDKSFRRHKDLRRSRRKRRVSPTTKLIASVCGSFVCFDSGVIYYIAVFRRKSQVVPGMLSLCWWGRCRSWSWRYKVVRYVSRPTLGNSDSRWWWL